ncbi:tetratricopeptide repeat protein [Massilia sp. PAMC28688]|uniref:tetratricopeptide repeat protein n=1 Tax=Massilia sp. PAMC28688 TaxID=2861283 RepID=UPI001C62F163|nr:tetratricopeptide repeat protein [Massilia sp. PAMC28688]QYF94767.1 tetratricopeptide repeat protein [Massilia sp. PAMC28688]
MKNAFAIVTLSGLLTACAVPPQQQLPPVSNTAEPLPAQEASDPGPLAITEAAQDAAQEASLPRVELTSALLYQLLKAEFDIRKGNTQAGYKGLLALAKKTRDPRLARRAAELAVHARQQGEALAAVKLWRELAPGAEDAGQYMLALAVMGGDLAQAEPLLARRLQQAAPQARGMAMYQAQQLLMRAPDRKGATALLDRLLQPYAATFEARVLLAQNAHARGDNAMAAEHARTALRLKPDSEVAVLTLAQVSKDPQAINAVLTDFLAANPGSREVRLAHARVLLANKHYDAARQQFMTLLAAQPDHPGTLYGLGLVAVEMGDRVAADRHLAHYVAVMEQGEQGGGEERELGRVLLLLSQLASDRGDHQAALRWVEKISERDAELYFAAQLVRATLVARQGDLGRARKLIAALTPEAPSSRAQMVLVESQILRGAGQLEAAYKLLAEGARRYPASNELLYDFALVAEKTGRWDVMEKTLRAIIKQAPNNHDAYNALGYSLAERNVRLHEALELIAKALQIAPDNPFIMDSMGWVHYRLGNMAEAESYLRRAYAMRPDADVAAHLGEVLWHKGDKAEARKVLREARAKDPTNDALRSTLSRLQLSL